jgi:TetR/AcrR family transcriptional repressor of nem operon
MKIAAERKRHPDVTRENLIRAAFDEIHKNGFRSANMDEILAKAGVTKGALYHHFESKTALGYAVVEEVVQRFILERWLRPLEEADDPIQAFIDVLRRQVEDCFLPRVVDFGCPLNNLAQEMSPVDEGFRQRIHRVYQLWIGGLADALRHGQEKGLVRADIDPNKTAVFITASLEGAVGMAKSARNPEVLLNWGESMIQYLEGLRPAR